MISKIKEKITEHKYKILAGISFATAAYLFHCYLNDDKNVKLSSFFSALQKQQLDEVVVSGDQVWFRSYASQWYYSSLGNYPVSQLFKLLKQYSITFSAQSQSLWPTLVIPMAVPTIGILAVFHSMNDKVSQDIQRDKKRTNTFQKFEHYYGGDRIKQVFKETIQYIKEPKVYKEMGVRLRRGMVLYGPPGTGKTMLARIIANQADLPFIPCSGSEFQEIFVGVGPKRIRNIFKTARQSKKGSIIFIDQLDAVGSRTDQWQTKEQRSTVNQLLCEIDGFEQNQNIFVIAATNNLPAVDPALLRPGRFDLKVFVPPPSQEDRAGILKAILAKKHVLHHLTQNDLQELAKLSQNWTGAHLQNLINQSLYSAIRHKQNQLFPVRVFETIKQLNNKQ